MKKQLAEIGLDVTAISQIVITHAHLDHYGLVGRLSQLSRAKISLHQLEKDVVDSRYRATEETLRQTEQWLGVNGVPTDTLAIPQRAFGGMRRPDNPPVPATILHDGEIISNGVFRLEVIWTPGHAPGHICLYEPEQKILFSGDHVLPVITPHVSISTQSNTTPANPLGDFISSMDKLKPLKVNLVLPAHEGSFTDLATRIEEILQHHEQRNKEILMTIRAKPKTAYQISTEITWMPSLGGVRWQRLSIWDKRAAIMETLAHLEALRVEGRVSKLTDDSVFLYQHN